MDKTEELYKEIDTFLNWADNYYPNWSEEHDNGEWETSDDSNFCEMCDAAINVINEYKCFNLDDKLIDALLFVVARDNECETIIEELVNYLDLFELLAKKSIGSKYVNAEWQFAKHLSDCKGCNQQLLSAFIESDSEYTSRMALWSMSELNPDDAEKYAIKFWNRGKYSEGSYEDEYQKIMALNVLEKIKSSKLEEYLGEALKSNYKMLIFNAEKIIQSLE